MDASHIPVWSLPTQITWSGQGISKEKLLRSKQITRSGQETSKEKFLGEKKPQES
jgi:hypothetical protein